MDYTPYDEQSFTTWSRTAITTRKICLPHLFCTPASPRNTLEIIRGPQTSKVYLYSKWFLIISYKLHLKKKSCTHSPKLLFSSFSISSTKNYDPSDHVLKGFVALLKTTLARMTGEGSLKNGQADLDFWSRWPKKFREAKRYKRNKIVQTQIDVEDEVQPQQQKRKASSPMKGEPSKKVGYISSTKME